ncbi:hypothetical protein AWC22_00775 [Mycobacterium riyadhense]|uniref:Uncharacterized protein n=1 Tax=Mycobacterium riyadhense TaxID=486698 RepID=A0A1X2B069_9MYCO|nr:hypothetical protein AWC22_00775 [Mycobacterium riyadhense]
MPEVVVLGDDLGRRHRRDVDVGDVALEANELAGAGQAGLVKEALVAFGGDESGLFGGFGSVDDGAGFLGIEGRGVAAGPFGRVLPDRPPRFGMLGRDPDRFGSEFDVVDPAAGMFRRDGVDDLSGAWRRQRICTDFT